MAVAAIFRPKTTNAKMTKPEAPDASPGRWPVVVLLLLLTIAIGVAGLDATFRLETVRKVSALTLTDVPPGSQRLPAGAFEETLLLPASSMDAKWWVLHARHLLDSGDWRVRSTSLDNAPDGREVHWSSLLVWLLAGTAQMLSMWSGTPATANVSHAALYAGPILLAAFVLLLGGLVFRRFGAGPAAFFLLFFVTSVPIARTFQAGEADHHGIVLGFAAAGLLAVIAGGAGFVVHGRRSGSDRALPVRSAESWFVAAGVFGGAALWVSAATAIPVLVGTAAGAVVATWIFRRNQTPWRSEPDLWMRWAVAGCVTSLAFYVIEYFPSNMGWRLEVNHPLYAAAWLGGGYLLRAILNLMLGRGRPQPARLAGAAVLAALPIGVVLWRGAATFWVSDAFLLALHREYILEFQSLFTLVHGQGGNVLAATYFLWPLFVLAAAATLTIRGIWAPAAARAFCVALVPALLMQALAIQQVRWMAAAFAMWAVCAVVLFIWGGNRLRWAAIAAGALVLALSQLPSMLLAWRTSETATRTPIGEDFGNGLILRDIAHRLLHSSPGGVPVVLTGPNSSTDIAYSGGVRVLGTLYWENMPGLKRAARVFAAADEKEALRVLAEAGVTHIVVPSWDNFGDAYARLLQNTSGGSPDASFFETVLSGEVTPDWLRPFAYPIPTESGLDARSVKIFAVLPRQSLFESQFFRGVFHFESRDWAAARELFAEAARLRPSDPRPRAYLEEMDRRTSKP